MSQSTDTRAKNATETKRTDVRKKRVEHLAREEFSRKSFSYAVTAISAVFFGLVVVPAFSSAVIPLEESARSVGWLVDFVFLAIVSILSINVISRSYFSLYHDPFRGWLAFLRSLPVSPKEMILARSLIMLPATAVLTTLFFTPIVIASATLDSRFDAATYFWLVAIWLGYALAAGGMNLLLELGVKGKLALVFQFVWLAAIVAVIWLLGGNLVYSTFTLADEYGPLVAGISLLIGGLFFALFAKATEKRVASREFVV
ncbi:MAG: ABC-2 transporter permease [Rubrobacteraceae bacterium]